jgi:hypothetical protein
MGVFVWMATQGPVSLGFITSRLESSINAGLGGVRLSFEDTILDWSADNGQANLALVGVTVHNAEGVLIARAPKVAMGLSSDALMQGRAVPRWVELISPSAVVLRQSDGRVRLGFTPGKNKSDAPDAAASPENGQQLQTALFDVVVDAMRHPERTSDLSRHLDRFSVRNAQITFKDEMTGTAWSAPAANLEIKRSKSGVTAVLNAAIALDGGQFWKISGNATLPRESEAIAVQAKFGDVLLSKFAKNGLAALKGVDIPVNGSARLLIGKGGLPGPIRISLASSGGTLAFPDWGGKKGVIGPLTSDLVLNTALARVELSNLTFTGKDSKGQISGSIQSVADEAQASVLDFRLAAQDLYLKLPALFAEPFSIQTAEFEGRVAGAAVTLQKATAKRGPFEIAVTGAYQDSAVSPAITLTGSFSNLTIADLRSLWPRFAAPNAHAWVLERVHTGHLTTGTVAVNLLADAIVDGIIPNEALEIAFDFQDMSATYLEGLTDLTDARGKAILHGDMFELAADQGRVAGLIVQKGKVTVPQMHMRGTIAAISGEASGSMKEILTLLDQPRLGYPKKFGLKPGSVDGSATFVFAFNVPTLKDLKAEEVGIDVKAQTKGLGLHINDKVSLDAGNLKIAVTGSGLTATGDGQINAVPLKLSWTENFSPGDRPSTTLEIEGVVDDQARTRLNADATPYVSGPVVLKAGFSGSGANVRMGTILLDFNRATVAAPELNWRQGPGNKIQATGKLSARANDLIILEDLRAIGIGVKVAGSIALDKGGVREANFSEVKLGSANDFAASAKLPETGEQKVTVTGRAIDASQLFKSLGKAKSEQPDSAVKASKPLSITAQIREVTLKGGAVLKDLSFKHQSDGVNMRGLEVSGEFAGGGALRADLAVQPDGRRRLRVTTGNAGRLLGALTEFNSMLGGRMSVSADLAPLPPPGAKSVGAPPRFSGFVKVEQFKVTDQPFLARLFAAGSFTGLGDLLSGDGITFTNLETHFDGVGDNIRISDGRANGPSIGVTYQGMIDRKADKVDFNGTLVPLYGLNSLFEDIPLLGDLLTSRKGEGIFAFTYDVAGSVDDLDVMVNPLSALTPGIFRRIFQAGKYPPVQAAVPEIVTTPAPALNAP